MIKKTLKICPPPWYVVPQAEDSGDKWFDIWSSTYGSIAHLYESARSDEGRQFLHADAQLIAAAPDLLDALMEMRNYTDHGGCWCDAFDRGRPPAHSFECEKARKATVQFHVENEA